MIRSFLQKLRGTLRTGLTWALGWSLTGTLLQGGLSVLGILRPPDLGVAPFMWGLMGFYGGTMFGALLSLTEGRRTLENLRIGRVAAWGALAGFALPVVYNLMRGDPGALSMMSLLNSALILAPLSAGSAAGMTAIAKRAGPDELSLEKDSVRLEGGKGVIT